jgi:hypothetical protein
MGKAQQVSAGEKCSTPSKRRTHEPPHRGPSAADDGPTAQRSYGADHYAPEPRGLLTPQAPERSKRVRPLVKQEDADNCSSDEVIG